MKLLNFTIIKLTICLILGVIIGYFYHVSLECNAYLLGFLLIVLTASYLIARHQFIKTIWFGIITFLTLVSAGVLTVNIHNQKNNSNHYSHVINGNNDSIKQITFKVKEVLKPSDYYDKYIVDLIKIDTHIVSGRTILNIENDSLKHPLNVDDVLFTKTTFKEVTPPLNPSLFNYKKYLEKKYIYHQLFINHKELLKLKTNEKTIFGVANNIRDYINSKLKTYTFSPYELAIINAILLGQRQTISEDVYTNYANAGAIHILAISGLHIGIILIILNHVLKPIEKLKYGLYFKTILLIIILWSFAIVAGLSASVTRAVTMFSIVAIGMHLKRPTNIYNTLAISIFVLLLFKPMFLFDVGFQLSYLAVLGIVTIDPYLYKLWIPKNKILKIYWHTLTITLSAQLGIIPISLFYFHNFPGLFFLSNLLIIPVLGIILGFGILVILLASVNLLPEFLSKIFAYIIRLMNHLVGWISQQEAFIIKDLSFSILYVVVAYFFTIAVIRFLIKRNYYRLVLLCASIILIQFSLLYTQFQSTKNEFLIFHKNRYSLIGNTIKNKMVFAHNFDSTTAKRDKIIANYLIKNHIKSHKKDALKQVYLLNDKKLLIIDSLGVYNVKTFKPDYILLTNSPKINLNRLIDSLHPSQIIADGSNYKNDVQRWKNTCKKTNIPFHQTSEKGAFIINY